MRRAATATVAPCRASALAVASPMPLLAPVTSATVPSSRSQPCPGTAVPTQAHASSAQRALEVGAVRVLLRVHAAEAEAGERRRRAQRRAAARRARPSRAAGHQVVGRGHRALVEHVDVEVDPERRWRRGRGCASCRRRPSARAPPGRGPRRPRAGPPAGARCPPPPRVARAEHDHVRGRGARAAGGLDPRRRAEAERDAHRHVGGLAGRRPAAVVDVHVPVDVRDAGAPTASRSPASAPGTSVQQPPSSERPRAA